MPNSIVPQELSDDSKGDQIGDGRLNSMICRTESSGHSFRIPHKFLPFHVHSQSNTYYLKSKAYLLTLGCLFSSTIVNIVARHSSSYLQVTYNQSITDTTWRSFVDFKVLQILHMTSSSFTLNLKFPLLTSSYLQEPFQ